MITGWEGDPPEGCIDIGSGHLFRWFSGPGPDGGDPVRGGTEWHQDADGDWCVGSLYFQETNGQPRFRVVLEDPLTIEPSIVCSRCDIHGWIRGGQWVPA